MDEINSFKKGLKDGLPIAIGYFSVSFAFGIFAIENGLTVFQAVIISLLNLTSAGQLAAVPIIAGGGTFLELALSQLVINSRYSLMSVSLSQKLSKKVKLPQKLLIAYGNTDEIFAVSVSNNGEVGTKYMLGIILLPVIGWTSGTLLGGVVGNILPPMVTAALGVAIYGMFVAIVMPVAKKEKMTALCVLLAIAISCAFRYIPLLKVVPTGFTVIICAVVASALFAIIAPIKTEEKEGA
ncbi:MAG: AzlC family ABC transporter permease [Acutalibacteraceae bacterium]|nr:AzlC family ABC transporter permease [Acutalibacteraceae bacterium]